MSKRFRLAGLRFAAFGVAAAVVFGLATMGLWNALMPATFGLPPIGIWQAIGLLILSRLLFGGFGVGRHRRWGRPRFMHSMTQEERERVREGIRRRCGIPFDSPAPPRV